MKVLKPARCLLFAALAVLVAGCATNHFMEPEEMIFKVSFPIGQLAPDEHVNRIALTLTHGHVVAINRFPKDWDTEVSWENPGRERVVLEERHFVSGIHDLHELDGFLTVAGARGDVAFDIEADLTTESPENLHRPSRNIHLARAELILKK